MISFEANDQFAYKNKLWKEYNIFIQYITIYLSGGFEVKAEIASDDEMSKMS